MTLLTYSDYISKPKYLSGMQGVSKDLNHLMTYIKFFSMQKKEKKHGEKNINFLVTPIIVYK